MEKRAWWWNEQVTKDISEKRRLWKLWKARDLDAKMPTCLLHNAQHAYYTAKINAKKDKFASVKDNKENNFCVTKNA